MEFGDTAGWKPALRRRGEAALTVQIRRQIGERSRSRSSAIRLLARATELIDNSSGRTRKIDVQVLEGNKVIEIRNSGVNTGTTALEGLTARESDFILGIGDDWTDEDLFRAVPPSTWSARVGLVNTAARYSLSNHTAVRRMLCETAAPNQPSENT